jgi:hypothetical protein
MAALPAALLVIDHRRVIATRHATTLSQSGSTILIPNDSEVLPAGNAILRASHIVPWLKSAELCSPHFLRCPIQFRGYRNFNCLHPRGLVDGPQPPGPGNAGFAEREQHLAVRTDSMT